MQAISGHNLLAILYEFSGGVQVESGGATSAKHGIHSMLDTVQCDNVQ